MINDEIATIFDRMSSYIELLDQSKTAFFKVRAYKKASEVIATLSVDLADPKFTQSPQLLIAMEGIGKTIATQIIEYVKTGVIQEYELLKAQSPLKLEELLQIQGLGTKKVQKLYRELNITDIDSLKLAADQNKIAQLPGFGDKSQQNIIESIQFMIVNKDKKLLADVEPIVIDYKSYMQKDVNLIKFEPLGSYRRKKEVVGDLDFLAISKSHTQTIAHFCKYPHVEKILSQGPTKASVWLKQKIQVDVRIVEADIAGATKQYFTGSKEHNVKLRNIAIDRGYKLSEYGLFDRTTNELIEAKSESKIYNLLGMQYIEPELRENRGEIESAIKKTLPQLITLDDIRGDMHTHTTWSDGTQSPIQMIQRAMELNYQYYGFSDHIGNLPIANAIKQDRFDKYLTELIAIKNHYHNKIKIYIGGEVEINKDGDYEIEDKYLSQLDYVIGAIHINTKMTSDQMTNRLLKAIKHPKTTFLAHLTGRLINKRPGYDFDHQTIFAECAKRNVAIEINSNPSRLDLPDNLVKSAIDKNVKIIINTDAHSAQELDNIQYGLNVARRGWVTKTDLYMPNS